MRIPVSWLRDYVDLPATLTPEALATRLTEFDLKLEAILRPGEDVTGPLVVGQVVDLVAEEHSNGKTVRWCQVDVGAEHNPGGRPRGIVCGALNFEVGDRVVVVLPGATLPGDRPGERLQISARRTYGHVSDGMICSPKELGLGDDGGGILVLDRDEAEVGDDAISLLGLHDVVLDLEVNPDRGYALSLRGVARDAGIAFGATFRDPALRRPSAPTAQPDSTDSYPVRVDAPAACPVFAARTVSGLDPSRTTPRWMARRIQLAGMRPISLAVDVTNYVMLELGQPIHGYDKARLSGPIVVRAAVPGEKLRTLDGVARELASTDLLITDDSGPIGLAGVMGGEHTELGSDTTDIVVEAAHFRAATIARTARTQKLPSEASRRFERGVDPTLPAVATARVAELLVEHGGATLEDGLTLVGEAPTMSAIALVPALSARVTGVDIAPPTVLDSLSANGCVVVDSGEMMTVTPPPWRPDLTDPYDLVEEVIRVVGYDAVPSVVPVAPVGRGLTTRQRLRRRVGYALAGAGCVELKSVPFVGPADLDHLGLSADDPRRNAVTIENPMSAEQPALTTTLLPLLLRGARVNVGRGQSDLALFEVAPVFLPGPGHGPAPILPVTRRPTDAQIASLDAALPAQPVHLAVLLTGHRSPAGWWGEARPAQWTDAIEVVREVARVLDVGIEVESTSFEPWHPGRCAQISHDGVVLGHAGELHPRVVGAYGLPPRTVAAEVDLDSLIAAATDVVTPPPLSTYPVAKEDVALVVDGSVPSAAVAQALVAGGGALLESVRLFDVYTGEPVPEGKKSLAFALRMRAPDRTLTEAESSRVRDAAVAAAFEATGAVQRT